MFCFPFSIEVQAKRVNHKLIRMFVSFTVADDDVHINLYLWIERMKMDM